MASINLTYKGLTGAYGSITGFDDTTTIDDLIAAIATDEGLDSNYYTVSKVGDPTDTLSITYGDSTTTVAALGIVNDDTILCTANQVGTKEARQIQKLDIAQRKRQGGPADDSSTDVPYYRTLNEYDRDSLPTKYVGNDTVDNSNPTGLLPGRPWISSETPILFSGLAIWYDTALASTINGGTFSDGTTLATLTNRATGTNGAPASLGREPTVQNGVGDTLNGYPVIRFATATTYDNIRFTTNSFDNATGWTVVMLAKTVITAGFNPTPFMITNSASSALTGIRYTSSSSQFSFTTPAGSATVDNSVDPDGTWKIITARYDSTAAAASRCTFRWAKTNITVTNGGTPPSGTVPDTATYVETMSAFDGDLAEQIAYNRALSDAEIIALENYLSSKWGV
jgi:hypothetical protein